MGMYKLEIDRPDGSTMTIDFKDDLNLAKQKAIELHEKYGYDVYIKETTCIFIRRTTQHEDAR